MSNKIKCVFCQTEKILKELPSSKNGTSIQCDRGIYEDAYCVATLAPEQYTKGHTLVVLKNHRTDMTDSSMSSEELSAFVSAIHKLARHLKENLRDPDTPQKIYVCSLCDGVEHLHAHLIPRYQFTNEDVETYRKLFRDDEKIEEDVRKGKLGGFWYISEREQNFKKTDFCKKSDDERARYLTELAQRLRLS